MHKNTLWYAAVLLVVYFTLVFCEEAENTETQIMDTEAFLNEAKELLEVEGRTRRHRHHLLFYRHLWPLAIAYFVKVKVVIVSFFVGSAIYLGLRYFWPQHQKCNQEIILDHPPPSFEHHHDHIPYSLDHSDHYSHYDSPASFDSSPSFDTSASSFDSGSFEPYSAYSGYSADHDISADDLHADPTAASAPSAPASANRRRGKRSVNADNAAAQLEIVDNEDSESEARQMATEEQVADFLFAFLGLDTKACRRRFVCEMEFRSKMNPLTSMAFRIVGRGFFEKYTNANNPQNRATSFAECGAVNPECIFIENPAEEESTEAPQAEAEPNTANAADNETTEENASESQNEQNLQAERRHAKLKHRRSKRMLSSIAERILVQK